MTRTDAAMLIPAAERQGALEHRFPVWHEQTLDAMLAQAAAEFPDREFVVTDDISYSYREIKEWSDRIATGLVASGIQPGEHVALVMANFPDFVATKFAIARAGAVAVPINFLNRRDELGYVLKQSNAVALITMDAFRNMDYLTALDELAPGWERNGGGEALPDLRFVAVLPTGVAPPREGTMTLAQLAASPGMLAANATDPSSAADILYTSGTTGNPKGVILTHDMLLRTAYGSAFSRAFEDGRRITFSLPLYHVYGYVEGLLAVAFVGGAIIPQLSFNAHDTLRGIVEHRASDALFVPTMTMSVLDALAEKKYDLSGLTCVISSGGYSPPWIWPQILEHLAPEELTTGYGMSETTATTMLTATDDTYAHVSTTNGRLRPAGRASDPTLNGTLVEYRVVDQDTGVTLAAGESGELIVRGLGVTPGYYNKPEENATAFDADGWFHSGDLGIIDADGYLVLGGRKKDLYRCGGELVVPKQIEDILLEHAAIAQAHVVPIADDRMGEVGVGWIVLKPGFTLGTDDVNVFLADRLARFKLPRHVFFLEATDVPVTPSGRPRKFLLSERAVGLVSAARPCEVAAGPAQ